MISLTNVSTHSPHISSSSGLVDNTGPGCGVRGARATGSVEKTGSRDLLGKETTTAIGFLHVDYTNWGPSEKTAD